MKKIRTLIKKYNCISSFICFVVILVTFMGLADMIHTLIQDDMKRLAVDCLARFAMGMLCILALSLCFNKKIGYWLKMRNSRVAFISSMAFIIYTAYHLSTIIIDGIRFASTPAVLLVLVVLQQIVTGFFEESMFRALLLEGLLEKTGNKWWGRALAGVISFLSFGYLHIMGVPWEEGWYTFVVTGTIGLAFSAIYICSRNLVILMVLHAVYDIVIHSFDYIIFKDSVFFWEMAEKVSYILIAVMFVYSWICIFFFRKDFQKACKKEEYILDR